MQTLAFHCGFSQSQALCACDNKPPTMRVRDRKFYKKSCELSRYLRISVTQVENENPLKFDFGTALAMHFF